MADTDYFSVKREGLKREHEKKNTALAACQKQFVEETERLANLNNHTVTFSTDDDGVPSVQLKTPNLADHISERLDTLAKELKGSFKGACLDWVEKEEKLAEKQSEFECAERYLGLYEGLVKRLQKLDWQILNGEAEEWKKGGKKSGGDEAVLDRDKQGGETHGDVSGNGSVNVGEANDGRIEAVEDRHDEKAETSTWGSGVEESGSGKNVWTGDELLEERNVNHVEVTAQGGSDDGPRVDDENCRGQ